MQRPPSAASIAAILSALLATSSAGGARQAPIPPQDLTRPFSRVLAGTIPTGLAVTSKGWVYLVGITRTTAFQPTSNAFDSTCGTDGRCNAFQGRFGIEYRGDVTLTVLDPDGVVHYASYVGGEGEDGAAKIALAPDGAVWLAGPTSSTQFEGVSGAGCGSSSIWIGRFDLALKTLRDFRCVPAASVVDLQVDAQGDAWLAGATSGGLPVANAWQPLPGGQIDTYVLEAAPGASTSRMGTYVGGNAIDSPAALTVSNGAIVVTGSTVSTNFPVVRAVQSIWAGPFPRNDAFLTSLDPTGGVAHFSTLIGGNGDDRGAALATDAAGNVFVLIQAASDNLPTSSDAYDRRCGTGASCSPFVADVYIAKFTPTGALIAATYFGGSGLDYPRHASVLADGSLLVGGSTQSTDLPIVPTTVVEPRAAETGFLAVFDANLRMLRRSALVTDAAHRPPTQAIAHERDFTYVAGQLTENGEPATYLRKYWRFAQ